MKKLFFGLSLLLAGVFTANAQEVSKNAIGLRFGDSGGFGTEISYQRKLNSNNRLEFGLGFRGDLDFIKASGLYEWVWQIDGNFNWYAGFGGGFVSANNTALFASGIVGIEYNFDFPLLISLDFRPEIGFNNINDGYNSDFGLSFRYQF